MPFSINVMRQFFAASEHIAPRLAGRLAFEIFTRTPDAKRLTPGEKRAVGRAEKFMEEARHHRLPIPGGCAMVHEFRPETNERRGTVLVVHGWRSRTEYMRSLIEGFRDAGFRVVSLDLPGHGGSSGRRLNMALAVQAVGAAAAWFGPFAAMVGHSFGGAVAVNAAVGSVKGVAPVAVDRLVAIASPSSMPRLFSEFGRHLSLGPKSQAIVDGYVLKLTGRPIDEFDTGRQLLRVPLPTLLIHDSDDHEVPADEARSASRAGKHIRLRLTNGLGHRRIISDPKVIEEAVGFVVSTHDEVRLH